MAKRADYKSQEDYCQECARVGGCNVILKDDEECEDRLEIKGGAPDAFDGTDELKDW